MTDPSATSQVLGFLVFAAFVALLYLAATITLRRFKTPAPGATGNTPRTGAGTKTQCDSNGCGYPASAWVIVADDLGGGVRRVCKGCEDEGRAFGWWKTRLPNNATALDFEIAGDLEVIEDYANGEASS
jgi:hypothetical protein